MVSKEKHMDHVVLEMGASLMALTLLLYYKVPFR